MKSREREREESGTATVNTAAQKPRDVCLTYGLSFTHCTSFLTEINDIGGNKRKNRGIYYFFL